MNVDSGKIKTYITTTILTFMGILSFQMSFLYTFYQNKYYSIPLMMLYVFILSAIFCGFVVFAKHKWILPVGITIFAGLLVWINFTKVWGGCGKVFNVVAEAAARYFNSDVLMVDMTKGMTKYGNPELFLYIIMGLFTLAFAYTISNGKAIIVPILITAAGIGIPVLFEEFPSFFAVLFGIVYCVEMVVISNVHVKKNPRNAFITHLTAIIAGVCLLIFGGFVNLISPSDEFKHDEFFEDIRDDFQSGFKGFEFDFDFFDSVVEKIKENSISSIGEGNLGHTDELSFSGKEVLKVTLPAKKDKVYLKGFVGAEYTSDKWKVPDIEGYEDLFSEMETMGYSQQGMVFEYLQLLEKEGKLNGYRAFMKVENIAATRGRYFAPIYIDVNSGIKLNADGPVESFSSNTMVEYYSVSNTDFAEDLDFIGTTEQGEEFWYYNELYTEYVESQYLDVNTPMADELEEMWGDYPIETGKDRLELAEDIKDWLAANCTYTKAPGKVPDDVDFVEYFLKETNEGYCTYFATAAVMMLRSAGVPARYVEGYSFNVSDKGTKVTTGSICIDGGETQNIDYCSVSVKDSNAHAWVEFYIDGIGWIDYEVTPGNSGGQMDAIPDESESESKEEESSSNLEDTSTQEDTTASEDDSKENTTEPSGEEESTADGGSFGENKFNFKLSKKAEKIILISFAGVLLAAFLILFIVFHHKKVEKDRESIYNKDMSDLSGKSVLLNFRRFERMMKFCGFKRAAYITYMDFAKMVEKDCYAVDSNEAQRITEVFEKIHYSDSILTVEEIEDCERIILTIHGRIYENIGLIRKIIFACILNY